MSPCASVTPAADRRWLSVGEACRYLSIGRTCLYDLVRAGELPERRIGRRLRFLTTDLDRAVSVPHASSVRRMPRVA